MITKCLQETTDWGSYTYVPNHTYFFDEKSQLVGYMKAGTSVVKLFKAPKKQFSKTRRKFKDVTKNFKLNEINC